MKKRFLTALALLCLLVALLPAMAMAEDGNYLTFSSAKSFTLKTANSGKNWDGTLEYSTDGTNWTEWNGKQISSSANGKLYLRGTGNSYLTMNYFADWDLYTYNAFVLKSSGSAGIACTGNIETLLDYDEVARGLHPTMAEECYQQLFDNCTSLTTAPKLPATTLTSGCYRSMFYNCTSLTAAPELPATTLASRCYLSMFTNCTGLTAAPELPATTLAYECYNGMFQNCTSLTTAPRLPATTLDIGCYYYMFAGCSNLTATPELPAVTLEKHCYGYMFQGCTGLTDVPQLPATTLAEYCYREMFSGCTNVKLADTQTVEYPLFWHVSTAAEPYKWNTNMFARTGGTFAGSPQANVMYYTSGIPIILHGNHQDACTHQTIAGTKNGLDTVYYSADTYPPVYADGYEHITYALQGWYTAPTGGIKVIDADGKLLANTPCTDANGVWKASALTNLYAQWKQIIYPAAAPNGSTAPQTVAQNEELTVRVNADAAKLITVQVDGKELVPDRDFTIKGTPLTVTLTPAYVSKLSLGAHTLTVLFTDGVANVAFTVLPVPAPAVPQTGDNTPIALWLALCALSALGCAIIRRKAKA